LDLGRPAPKQPPCSPHLAASSRLGGQVSERRACGLLRTRATSSPSPDDEDHYFRLITAMMTAPKRATNSKMDGRQMAAEAPLGTASGASGGPRPFDLCVCSQSLSRHSLSLCLASQSLRWMTPVRPEVAAGQRAVGVVGAGQRFELVMVAVWSHRERVSSEKAPS